MERFHKPYVLLKPDPKNGHPYWRYRIPGDPTRSARSTGQKRKSDANRWVELNMLGATKGRGAEANIPRLRDYALNAFDEYVRSREVRNKPLSTLYVKRQRRLIERFLISAPIAAKRLDEITLADSERFETYLLETYSDKKPTMKQVVAAYQLVMSRARREGFATGSPATGMDHHKVESKRRSIYTMAEITKLFPRAALQGDTFDPWRGLSEYTAFLVALTTGMRKGEVLALDWSAVHLDARREHLEILSSLNDHGVISPPKSRRPRATPIFDFVFWPKERRTVEALCRLRKAGNVVMIDGPVFADAAGNRRKGTWWSQQVRAALSNAGVERNRGEEYLPLDAHSMRHTLASQLKAAGMPDGLIQQFCGWSGGQIQSNYTHFDPDIVGRLMELVTVAK